MDIYFENTKHEISIKDTKTTRFSFPLHMQNQLEYCICFDGEVGVSCSGMDKILYSGEIMIALPNVLHSYNIDKDAFYQMGIIDIRYLNNIAPYFKYNLDEPFFLCDDYIIDLFYRASENSAKTEIAINYCQLALSLVLSNGVFSRQQSTFDKDILLKTLDYISQNFRQNFTLSKASHELGLNSSYLSRMFKQKMGISLTSYINILKVDYSKNLLQNSSMKMTDIAFESGFDTQRSFNRVFKEVTSMSPLHYRLL